MKYQRGSLQGEMSPKRFVEAAKQLSGQDALTLSDVFDCDGTDLLGWALESRGSPVALAMSLLTTTAGRLLLASDPRTGSRSTNRISPRRISSGDHRP